ncbi:hypothetical protein OIO90_000522 [Microbotryomycetes sp. JL221]|nr:hypothetical protein OIO90_000522 [Microbotryomycetes sp. JL221]
MVFGLFGTKSDGQQRRGPRYITAKEAQMIDKELMGSDGAFSIDQLMELAGLSIAQWVAQLYPLGPELPLDEEGRRQKRHNERILCVAGPGNQGGDGLVAARHLHHFGYSTSIFYPKESSGELFQRLKRQCDNLELPFIAPPPSTSSSFPAAPDAQDVAFKRALAGADVVLDCVFGFSFKPPARAPFLTVMQEFKKTDKPILSVDIPSGWDVEQGNTTDGFTPTALLSLTAPKLGVKEYAEQGRTHWLGGRFIPHLMDQHYDLNLPPYPGTMQCVDITQRA